MDSQSLGGRGEPDPVATIVVGSITVVAVIVLRRRSISGDCGRPWIGCCYGRFGGVANRTRLTTAVRASYRLSIGHRVVLPTLRDRLGRCRVEGRKGRCEAGRVSELSTPTEPEDEELLRRVNNRVGAELRNVGRSATGSWAAPCSSNGRMVAPASSPGSSDR